MTILSKDEILRLAREAGLHTEQLSINGLLAHFATLCRADLVEDLVKHRALLLRHLAEIDPLREEVASLRAENERLASLAKEYRDNGDRLLDVTDSLRAELSALRAWSGEAVKPLPGADWTITMRRMMAGGCSKRKCTCKAGNEQNCIWWDEPGDAPQPSGVKQEAVAWLHTETKLMVYASEVAKTSRNEQRINSGEFVPLYTHPQPSAVGVVRELVEALHVAVLTDIKEPEFSAICEAITKGQQWLKECGE